VVAISKCECDRIVEIKVIVSKKGDRNSILIRQEVIFSAL
jgi:hypothetical protein